MTAPARNADPRTCPHVRSFEADGYPHNRRGECHTYAVCEDCGTVLGIIGKTSVL